MKANWVVRNVNSLFTPPFLPLARSMVLMGRPLAGATSDSVTSTACMEGDTERQKTSQNMVASGGGGFR